MKKEDRFGIECELSGAEQIIRMIREEAKKPKSNTAQMLEWARDLQLNVGFVVHTLVLWEVLPCSKIQKVKGVSHE